ncbi:hypothetical protein ACTFIR_003959 [Dictyostelium discoideum]
MRIIQGVFAWLIGMARICEIEALASQSILFSDLTILRACVKLLIKNKTDAFSLITEKLQSANFTLKEEKEQITLFVNRAINLAFDMPVQELHSIKADELKSVTPLSHFQEEEALSSMSLDNIERNDGQEALVFIHQRKSEEGSIILSIDRVETAIHTLTGVDSYTERSALVKERILISEHDIIYSFRCCFRPNSTRCLNKRADLLYSASLWWSYQKDAIRVSILDLETQKHLEKLGITFPLKEDKGIETACSEHIVQDVNQNKERISLSPLKIGSLHYAL